jgi:enamine deaminase RidA (YjgF/YER057c/UK114 family)
VATHDRLNPPTLFDARLLAYSQVMKSTGGTFIQIAGQAALDRNLALVGEGDFAAQARQCFENLGHALDAAGAMPADVNSIRIYVVDMRPDYVPVLKQALEEFFGEALPPGTLVGVASLSMPGLLIEVEATAVV